VLRVEVQTFEVAADARQFDLVARWWLADPEGRAPALVRQFEHHLPLKDAEPDTLVAAHRQALWALAQDIVRTADRPDRPRCRRRRELSDIKADAAPGDRIALGHAHAPGAFA
jgi:hypothetical protein